VRAGLDAHASEWPWSSYRPTIGNSKALEWLAVAELLSEFSSNAATVLNAFRQFVDAGVTAPTPWKELRREPPSGTLGDDLPVLPHVERRSIHTRRTPRDSLGTNQCPLDAGGEPRIPIQAFTGTFRFHGPDSISFGGLLELS